MIAGVDRVLVLAPHTDDGEFGCGGTIARMVDEGKRVHYVALSACEDSVPRGFPKDILATEVKDATRVLGIRPEDLTIGEFRVRTFDQVRQQVLDLFVSIHRELQPQLVFMPSLNDLHQDHQTVAREGLRAFKRTTLLSYEMPWNNLSFQSQCFVALTPRHVDRKLAALACYKSQRQRTYAGAEYQRAHLLTRGQQIDCPFAECFEVVRWTIR